ncbi:MAG: hypothetical protein M1388_00975 [Thaumarchaeota archaeon]|nr:hypothetical protein [Nitrososphaerota archaeon]
MNSDIDSMKYSIIDYEENLRERIYEELQTVNSEIMERINEHEERLVHLESRVRTLEDDTIRDAIIFNASRYHITPEEYLKRLGNLANGDWT